MRKATLFRVLLAGLAGLICTSLASGVSARSNTWTGDGPEDGQPSQGVIPTYIEVVGQFNKSNYAADLESGYVLQETITVPVDGSSVSSTTMLRSDTLYEIRAAGTFFVGGPGDMQGDAEYANFSNPPSSLQNHCAGDPNDIDLGIGINDNVIDNEKVPFWGDFEPSYVYTVTLAGLGAPIALNYHDCAYDDNSGALTVEVWRPAAITWHVSIDGSDLTGDGSEARPFATIQHGIEASNDGDTVLAHPGIYTENINFGGKEIIVGSLFITTGDSDYILETVIDGNRNDHVVTFAEGEAGTARLSGFTITNGYAEAGGGIFCAYSDPSLTHLRITDNESQMWGGGLYFDHCSPTLRNIAITNNRAGDDGGGILYAYSNADLENVVVAHNSTRNGGAGIFFYWTDGLVRNALIVDNVDIAQSSNRGGGGMMFDGGSPTLVNVTVAGNRTTGSGGGLNVSYMSQPTLVNSIVWGNTPEQIVFDQNWIGMAITVEHSDIQGGQAGIITHDLGPVNWGEGNLDTSPRFVQPTLTNYRLADNSPAIGAGTTVDASPADIEGNLRPNPAGSDPDMGAYENARGLPVQETKVYLPLVYNNFGTCGVGFSDEFNGSLDTRWSWIDPNDDATHTLTVQPGFLSTSAPTGNDLYPDYDYDAPRLLQPIDGDFVAETSIEFEASQLYQGAGILIWQDSDNFVRLELGYVNARAIVFDKEENGVYNRIIPNDTMTTSATQIELRVQQTGDHIVAWWRERGGVWRYIGDTEMRFSAQVWGGLALIVGHNAPQTTADFDYFRLSCADAAADDKIYFAAGDVLYKMNLDGSDRLAVASGLASNRNQGLFADPLSNTIYANGWDQPAQIKVLDTSTGALADFSDGPGNGGTGLAVNPEGHTLYEGLYYDGIYALDMNNGSWTQLVNSDELYPMHGQRGQLQIDPNRRQMYFRTSYNGNCGECRYIWRVGFAGDGLTQIITANGGDALALDLFERKMYFSDVPGEGTIKWAYMEPGSSKETLFTLPEPYRYCRSIHLDLGNRKMYLNLYDEDTGYRDRAIARMNMDGTGFEILRTLTGNDWLDIHGDMALFSPAPPPPPLLVRYDFEDDFLASGIIIDRSGNGHDAQVMGEVAAGAGISGGQGISLNGNGYIQAASNPAAGKTDITFSLWFKTDQPGENYKLASAAWWNWDLRASGWIIGTHIPEFWSDDEVGLYLPGIVNNDNGFLAGAWNHEVITYDGSRIKEYTNGQLINDWPTTGVAIGTGLPMAVGAWPMFSGYNFQGSLDEFAIYDRSLTQQEVQALYAQGR